jgi:hypothetical protein
MFSNSIHIVINDRIPFVGLYKNILVKAIENIKGFKYLDELYVQKVILS